jgi:TonB family protein
VAPAAAQEPSASISGTISDASGAVIPGVGVTLLNVDATSDQKIVSNPAGFFQFADLPAGRYLLQVQLPGFHTFNSRLIELQGNEKVRQNVTLAIGSIVSRVDVSAAGTPRAVPASEAAAPRRIRVGGNIQAANLITQVKPVYPQSARDAGVEGTVRLQGVIGADGSMLSLAVLNEGQVDPELASAARGAVSQWRYRPTLLNGTPIEVITTIEVNFTLAQ